MKTKIISLIKTNMTLYLPKWKQWINKYFRVSDIDTFENPYEPIDLSNKTRIKNNARKRIANRNRLKVANSLRIFSGILFISGMFCIVAGGANNIL